MRIELRNRIAPLVLGGRVCLEPGVNEVRRSNWDVVCDAALTRFYVAEGVVVLSEPTSPSLPVLPPEPSVTPWPAAPPPQAEVSEVDDDVPHFSTAHSRRGRRRK